MEFQKIVNFLDITSDNEDLPRYVTKKWIEVYDQSQGNYDVNKEIRIKTSISDVYIVAKGDITVTKKTFTANDFEILIIHKIMQLLLILQIIMHLVKRNWFLKIMHHLSIVFQRLMV